MATIQSITRANWAPHIKAAAYGIGAAIAFAYTAGLLAGEWLHSLNDAIAAAVSGRRADHVPAAGKMVVQRQSPQHVATIAAPDLSTLTVAQLRVMARAAGHKGIARSGRRAQLLQVLA